MDGKLYENRISRRRMIKVFGTLGAGLAALSLASCAPAAAPSKAPEAKAPEKAAPTTAAESKAPAAGKAATKAEGKVNVICFAGEVATAIRKLSEDFMKENSQIQVNLEEVDFATAEKKMWLDFASKGGAYDTIVMLNFWFGRAMKESDLAPIDGYIKNDPKDLKLDDYAPPVISTTQRDGKNYGFPAQAGDKLIYYRADKFKEAGVQPPAISKDTWNVSDFLDLAKKFNDPKNEFYGAAPGGKSTTGLTWKWAEHLHSEGLDMFDKDFRPKIDVPESVQYLKWSKDLFNNYSNPGAAAQADDEGTNMFLQGKTALLEQWGDVGPRVFDPKQTSLKPEQVGYAPIPKGIGPKATIAPFFAMWSTVLSQFSKNPAAAYEFMSWLSLKDKEFFLLGGIPCRNSTYSDPELLKKYPHLEVIGKTMPFARSLPSFPEWTEVSKYVGEANQKVIIGEMEPEAAAKKAQEDVDKLMKQAGYYS